MATPAEIVAAIDTAIASGAAGPLTVDHKGRKITYRTMEDLLMAREYFAGLARTASGRLGFRMTKLQNGGRRPT